MTGVPVLNLPYSQQRGGFVCCTQCNRYVPAYHADGYPASITIAAGPSSPGAFTDFTSGFNSCRIISTAMPERAGTAFCSGMIPFWRPSAVLLVRNVLNPWHSWRHARNWTAVVGEPAAIRTGAATRPRQPLMIQEGGGVPAPENAEQNRSRK
jgi:hypothetical protein